MREEVEREKRRWQKSETGMREQDRSEEENAEDRDCERNLEREGTFSREGRGVKEKIQSACREEERKRK